MAKRIKVADGIKVANQLTLVRITWAVRRSSQSILNEINPEYSSEGLMLSSSIWLLDAKSQLIRKDCGQNKKAEAEDEIVR